jgi:hypothetical protein
MRMIEAGGISADKGQLHHGKEAGVDIGSLCIADVVLHAKELARKPESAVVDEAGNRSADGFSHRAGHGFIAFQFASILHIQADGV